MMISIWFQDVLKPVLRKDWNCPWVKRDGKGLKKVIRNYYGTEPVSAPIKTSRTHFYRLVVLAVDKLV